ncbi:MAG: hypothetical protein ACYCZK_07775 [Microbacteriaceae bacterium]
MNMVTPSWRDRLKPAELLVIAGVIALFVGLVVFGTTREPVLGLVFLGIAFVVSLVVLAMLALAVKPGPDEQIDLDEQDGVKGL